MTCYIKYLFEVNLVLTRNIYSAKQASHHPDITSNNKNYIIRETKIKHTPDTKEPLYD